jgi:hypothetical protein
MGLSVLTAVLAAFFGQSGQSTVQNAAIQLVAFGHYRVQHADPNVIVALLTGASPPFPEIGTGAPYGFTLPPASQGGWLIPEGTLFVDPTDNTIYYKPKV